MHVASALRDIARMDQDLPTPEDRDAARVEAGTLRRQQAAEDWKWLMSSKQGRRVVHRVLALTGMHRSSFTGNSETFFREGRRAVGLEIEAEIIKHAAGGYADMVREQGIPQ